MANQIALLGIPGSGKSELAAAIEEYYVKGDGKCADCNTPVEIVDDYAPWVGDHGDWAIGFDGGWLTNVAIAIERYNQERVAARKAKTVITCGTIIESSVYSAMYFESVAKFNDSDPGQIADFQMRIEAVLRLFGTMYVDTFKYSKAFYLPPAKEVEEERFAILDRNIQAGFSAFNLNPITPIVIDDAKDLEDLTKKRLEKVFDESSVEGQDVQPASSK